MREPKGPVTVNDLHLTEYEAQIASSRRQREKALSFWSWLMLASVFALSLSCSLYVGPGGLLIAISVLLGCAIAFKIVLAGYLNSGKRLSLAAGVICALSQGLMLMTMEGASGFWWLALLAFIADITLAYFIGSVIGRRASS